MNPEPEPDVFVTYPSSSCRLSPCAPEQCLLIAPVYPLFISRRQPISPYRYRSLIVPANPIAATVLPYLYLDCSSHLLYRTTVSLSGLFNISSTLPYCKQMTKPYRYSLVPISRTVIPSHISQAVSYLSAEFLLNRSSLWGAGIEPASSRQGIYF